MSSTTEGPLMSLLLGTWVSPHSARIRLETPQALRLFSRTWRVARERLGGGRRVLRAAQLGVEPGAGVGPVALGRGQRDAEDLGGFGHRQAREEAQFH